MRTGTWLRHRHPKLTTRHLQLSTRKRPLEEEFSDEESVFAADGCEACCIKKRVDTNGTRPEVYIVAAQEGSLNAGWRRLALRRLKRSRRSS
ncbi:MAG: putative zinc-binding protein [Halobacteriota archaeon]